MNYYHVLEAVGMLVGGLLFYSYTYSWIPPGRSDRRLHRAALNGAAFGAIAVWLMIARIEIAPGVFIDARAVPVALIGLFEGWPAALIACAIGTVYRASLGGSGAWGGITSMILTGVAAGVVHAMARRAGGVRARHAALLTALVFGVTWVGFAVLGARGLQLFAPVWIDYLVTLIIGIGVLFKLFRDVVEQHLLAAAQQRYRAILDEASEVVRIVDPDSLRILDTNRADCELSGYTREEILARTARDFWPGDARERAEGQALFVEVGAQGHGQQLAAGYRTKTGDVLRMDATYRVLAYEGRRYGIAILRDASRRLAAEAAQREAGELRAATLLARAAAHEIHNPLAVILGYLQLMEPGLPPESKQAGWVRQMVEASGRIREAVDRLTRLIRIESTTPTGGAPVMLDTHRSTGADGGTASATPPGHVRSSTPR